MHHGLNITWKENGKQCILHAQVWFLSLILYLKDAHLPSRIVCILRNTLGLP